MNRNQRLKQIRTRDQLKRRELCELTGYKRSTVDSWLLPVTSPHYQFMPEQAMRLLEFETGRRQPRLPDNRLNDYPVRRQ